MVVTHEVLVRVLVPAAVPSDALVISIVLVAAEVASALGPLLSGGGSTWVRRGPGHIAVVFVIGSASGRWPSDLLIVVVFICIAPLATITALVVTVNGTRPHDGLVTVVCGFITIVVPITVICKSCLLLLG